MSSTTKKDGASFVSTAQTFDPMDRHRRFWDYVREKNWEAVASFIDKKVNILCSFEL